LPGWKKDEWRKQVVEVSLVPPEKRPRTKDDDEDEEDWDMTLNTYKPCQFGSAYEILRLTVRCVIDDAIGGCPAVEQAHGQILPVPRVMVEIEIILEIASHPPESIDRSIGELAFGGELFRIEKLPRTRSGKSISVGSARPGADPCS
jgi:hypothetical protein